MIPQMLPIAWIGTSLLATFIASMWHTLLRRSLPLRRRIARRWERLWMDEMTAFLSESTDFVDLECRIREWNEADRRERFPLL